MKFVLGCNLPGYLPDYPPVEYSQWTSARCALESMVANAFDELLDKCDNKKKFQELRATQKTMVYDIGKLKKKAQSVVYHVGQKDYWLEIID